MADKKRRVLLLGDVPDELWALLDEHKPENTEIVDYKKKRKLSIAPRKKRESTETEPHNQEPFFRISQNRGIFIPQARKLVPMANRRRR